MNKKQQYRANPVVSCRCVSSDYFELFNPDINKVSTINETGKDIFELLETPHTLSEICSHIMSLYDIDIHRVTPDIIEFLTNTQPDFIVECSL